MLKSGALPASMSEAAKEKLMAKIKHGGNLVIFPVLRKI
jgi:hypothetical protein